MERSMVLVAIQIVHRCMNVSKAEIVAPTRAEPASSRFYVTANSLAPTVFTGELEQQQTPSSPEALARDNLLTEVP